MNTIQKQKLNWERLTAAGLSAWFAFISPPDVSASYTTAPYKIVKGSHGFTSLKRMPNDVYHAIGTSRELAQAKSVCQSDFDESVPF